MAKVKQLISVEITKARGWTERDMEFVRDFLSYLYDNILGIFTDEIGYLAVSEYFNGKQHGKFSDYWDGYV